MIPCRQACFHVFYCSNKCEEEQWRKIHQYECYFIDRICNLKDYDDNEYVINYALLVMRMNTQRLNDILNESKNISVEDVFMLLSYVDEFTSGKRDEFGIVAKLLTEYLLTKLISHLSKNNNEFISLIKSFLPDHVDINKVEINNCNPWLTDIIRLCSLSNDVIIIKELKSLLIKVYILICIEEVNGFFHSSFIFDSYSQSSHVFALGVYPSAAFINHSCSPNIDRIFINESHTKYQMGDMIFFAAYFLKTDEELCISYMEQKYDLYMENQINIDEIIKSQIMRKERLKNEYFFNCQCKRCFNESNGNIDQSFMTLKELKCTKSKCQGWFIPSSEKHQMFCEACQMLR